MKYQLLIRSLVLCVSGSMLAGLPALAQLLPSQDVWPERRGAENLFTPQTAMVQNLTRVPGAMVTDRNGATIGQIQDVLTGPQTGNINFAVVSLRGQPGVLTAVPWALLRPTGPNTFELNTDPNRFQTAQTFPSNQWPNLTRSDYWPRIYAHYGLTYPPEAVGGQVALPSGVQAGVGYPGYPFIRPQPDGREVFPWMD